MKKAVALLMIIPLLLSALTGNVSAAGLESSAYDALITPQEIALLLDQVSYSQYQEDCAQTPLGEQPVVLDGGSYQSAQGDVAQVVNLAGSQGTSVVGGEGSKITWAFELPQAGLYQLQVEYYPVAGNGGNMERQILINGKVPFQGADLIRFYRIWENESPIQQDQRGNDLRPLQVEAPSWQTAFVRDAEGFHSEPYRFRFEAGQNTLTLSAIQENMAVRRIVLTQQDEVKSYQEIKAGYGGQSSAEQSVVLQGEDAAFKSNSTLYPANDRSSPKTVPYDPALIRMNTIGGENWKQVGQWISWKLEIPESGLYSMDIKYRQNVTSGLTVMRALQIDGAYPFQEARELRFTYKNDWQNLRVGQEGEDFLFYLEKGTHVITLEAAMGRELGGILERIENSVYQLNLAYRDMLVVIGSTPDPYRDYELEQKVSEALAMLKEQKRVLEGISADLKEYFKGSKGTNSASLDQLLYQLGLIEQDANSVSKWWSSFKDNIVALSTWELSMKEQPLEIDYIALGPAGAPQPQVKATFWEGLVYEFQSFISSFVTDYSSLGNVYGSEAINVWSLTGMAGRDQTQILKNMVDNSFVPQYGIPVNVQMVDGGVLLPATLAGRGPDIALHSGGSDPVNYALRNAVADLTQFPDFQEASRQFYSESLTPFQLNGGVYALPETMSFLVMFYRADILAGLGLEVPKTWEQFREAVSIIQKNNLNVGLPVEGAGNLMLTYSMFLMQSGEELYNEARTATNLYSETAVQTFTQWTSLFSDYKLPVTYNFANRFRTGEMPLAIADYIQYNYLSVFAPEIKGLWGFTLVPGTRRADGTVDHTSPVSVSSTIIMEQSDKKEQAWQFMKWWLSRDIQQEYGNSLENILGVSGRLSTANKEAMTMLPWTARDLKVLEAQLEEIRGIPEIAGGYFLPRHISNAFYSVYNSGGNPREVLEEYTLVIHNEITNKRKEFGMPVE